MKKKDLTEASRRAIFRFVMKAPNQDFLEEALVRGRGELPFLA
jgi:hypothetical protein